MSFALGFGIASTAHAQAAEPQSMSSDEAQRLGAAAGVISPRLADCGAHCAKQLGDVTRAIGDQQRTQFMQSCRDACEKQMAGVRPPAQQRAHKAAADWRSLYLMTMLMEQSAFCIGKLKDPSTEARALVNALEAAKNTPEAKAADALERRAGEIGQELGRTEEGRRAKAAHEELFRLNESKGPRSAEANAAREAHARARAVADATPVGNRMAEAIAHAQQARAKANETAAAAAAVQAYQAHNEAWRARVRSSPEAEQTRLTLAMTECIKAYGDEQMRRHTKP